MKPTPGKNLRKFTSTIIPQSTELLSRKIHVLIDSEEIRKSGSYGQANPVTCDIHLSTSMDGQLIPVEELEITYLHEVFHLILAKNGYEPKLSKADIDLEDLVEDLAIGIHQVLTKAVH